MPYGKKDSAMKMKGSWMSKHVQNLFKEMPIDNKASALEMEKGSAAYMKDDMAPKMESPMEKALVGDQPNLNDGLKKAIKAKSPAEMKGSAVYLHDEFTQKNNIKHR